MSTKAQRQLAKKISDLVIESIDDYKASFLKPKDLDPWAKMDPRRSSGFGVSANTNIGGPVQEVEGKFVDLRTLLLNAYDGMNPSEEAMAKAILGLRTITEDFEFFYKRDYGKEVP